MALTSWDLLVKSIKEKAGGVMLLVKGNADNNLYPLEVDPATGGLPITGTITATSASTGPTGSPVPAQATYAGYNDGSGNLVGLVLNGGALPVTPIGFNAIFQSEGNIVGTSLTGTYATIFTTAGAMKMLFLRSSCNQPVVISMDGGTTSTFILEQGNSVSFDFATDGMKIGAGVNIQVKHNGVVPTAGTVRVNGAY